MLATISLAARRGNTSRDSVGMKPASTCGRFPLLSFLILSPFACLPSLQICFFRVRLTPHVCIESIWEYGVWVGGMTSSFVLFGNLNACNGTFRKPVRPCTVTSRGRAPTLLFSRQWRACGCSRDKYMKLLHWVSPIAHIFQYYLFDWIPTSMKRPGGCPGLPHLSPLGPRQFTPLLPGDYKGGPPH